MIKSIVLGVVSAMLVFTAAACSSERCEDLSANAIEGTYGGDPDIPSAQVADARVEASSEQVTVTYARPDGRRFIATYRVKKTIP
jgi:hypothetical protein